MHTSDAIIEIRDLTFGYDAGNPVLDSINLTVKRGQAKARCCGFYSVC